MQDKDVVCVEMAHHGAVHQSGHAGGNFFRRADHRRACDALAPALTLSVLITSEPIRNPESTKKISTPTQPLNSSQRTQRGSAFGDILHVPAAQRDANDEIAAGMAHGIDQFLISRGFKGWCLVRIAGMQMHDGCSRIQESYTIPRVLNALMKMAVKNHLHSSLLE